MSVFWESPFVKAQKGVVGHLVGGWIVAPIFTAQSGAPMGVFNLNGSTESFGELNPATGSTNANGAQILDGAVLASKYTGGNSANYNTTLLETTSRCARLNSPGGHRRETVYKFSNPDQR